MKKTGFILLLILLLAFGLRFYALGDIPPGLTHDEANHGREAIGILDGVFLFYFPLNYGSEPLYSYTVAASMLLLGENVLALRLVNVVFSVAAIGLTFLWTRQAFDRRTALVTAVLMSVSFWSLASSREALRAGLLPFFMVGAAWFYWRLVQRPKESDQVRWSWLVIGFGVCVGMTLHIYLAARVAWLVFPVFLLYLAWQHRALFRRVWPPTLLGLGLTCLLVTPMFIYLEQYPYALTRLEMLDRPLQDLQAGNVLPILQNMAEALLAFVWPGFGDQFLAYNIPGRPVFDGVTAVFFVIGLLVSLWRWRRPAYAFVLLWFGIGILPSLVTGATANTTRNLAALAPVFILPGIGFWRLVDWLKKRWSRLSATAVTGVAAVWLIFAGITAVIDYFVDWAQSPAVRGAYQRNLVEALAYLETHPVNGPVVISSVYPGPAHDPSIALVLADEETPPLRWVDARYALLFPGGAFAEAIIPASTPPHPAFAGWLTAQETISLRADDLDPAFTRYRLAADTIGMDRRGTAVSNLGNAVALLEARWLTENSAPGETAELLTVWRVLDPTRVGPIVPPAFTPDVVLFTQVLDEADNVLTQRDSLEAPAWDWQAGDIIVQVHPVLIPVDTAPGAYPTIVGLYDRASGQRLPALDETGTAVGDFLTVPSLEIKQP